MTKQNVATMRDNAALRWLVLLLISGLMFATYYFQDFYSGLRDLMETDFGFTSEQFGRILGLTTFANVFGMIIVGGIILDKWGIRLAGFVFGGLATLGGLISALAASQIILPDNTLLGLIIGRILFGIGLEVVCVIVMRCIVKWFKGNEVALAMGLNVGVGRLGSAMAIAISIDIAGGAVAPAVTFAATLIGIAMLMFIIYTLLDYKIDKQDARLAAVEAENNPEAAAKLKAEQDADEFKFSDLVKLVKNKSFIYITLLCVAFYSAVFPFMQYAPDMLVNKFGFSYVGPAGGELIIGGSPAMGTALIYFIVFVFALGVTLIPNNIKDPNTKKIVRYTFIIAFAVIIFLNREMIGLILQNAPKTAALIPLLTIIFTPIFGSYIDKKGKAATIMMLGALVLIIAHLSFVLSSNPAFAYIGLFSLGIAFSLLPAAMWPSVAKIVSEKRLGTAYAAMFTVQNWGLGLFFWGIGALLIAIPENRETKGEIDDVRSNLIVAEAPGEPGQTPEFVIAYLDEIDEKIRNANPELEEDVLLFLDDAKEFLKEERFLTSGQVGEVIKIKQANGLLEFYDYTIPILILVLCGVISIFLAFKLKQSDRKQDLGLEFPVKE